MLTKTPIAFANWEPDRSELSGAAVIVKGVLSTGGTYGPWPSLATYRSGTQIADRALGGFTAYTSGGSATSFIGDRSRLYRVLAGTPTDISKSGGYAADADWAWQFEQFGDNIIAVARGVPAQRYIIGTTPSFGDLTGDPPTADVVGRIRQWLFLGAGRTVSVSGFNDVTDWTYDSATQGLQTVVSQEAGQITKIVGGENGAIFQERGIIRVSFTGGAVPFLFDEVEGGRGAASPNSVTPFGRVWYCVAEDGFYVFNGLETQALGASRVDEWWSERLNYGQRARITTAFDARRKTWLIAYPTQGSSICNEILAYNIADNRWTYCDERTHLLFEMPYEGVSVDDASAIAALVGTTNADQIDVSVDSSIWRESRRQWAAIGESRAISLFTGAPRAATLETATFEPTVGGKSFVNEVWPITDAQPEDVTGTIIARLHTQGETEVEDGSTMMDEGFCPVMADGRYLRARVSIASGADWTEVQGVHVNGRPSGAR